MVDFAPLNDSIAGLLSSKGNTVFDPKYFQILVHSDAYALIEYTDFRYSILFRYFQNSVTQNCHLKYSAEIAPYLNKFSISKLTNG